MLYESIKKDECSSNCEVCLFAGLITSTYFDSDPYALPIHKSIGNYPIAGTHWCSTYNIWSCWTNSKPSISIHPSLATRHHCTSYIYIYWGYLGFISCCSHATKLYTRATWRSLPPAPQTWVRRRWAAGRQRLKNIKVRCFQPQNWRSNTKCQWKHVNISENLL